MNQKISHHSIKINAVYSTFKTKFLFRNKDKIDPSVCSSIVYKYICDSCNKVYYGSTEKHFKTRAEKILRGGVKQKEQILKSFVIFNTHSLLKHSTSIMKKLALSLMPVSATHHYNFSAMAMQ